MTNVSPSPNPTVSPTASATSFRWAAELAAIDELVDVADVKKEVLVGGTKLGRMIDGGNVCVGRKEEEALHRTG